MFEKRKKLLTSDACENRKIREKDYSNHFCENCRIKNCFSCWVKSRGGSDFFEL